MSRCDVLKQLKSDGAPASSRAGLAVKPAREDAGAPVSEENRPDQCSIGKPKV